MDDGGRNGGSVGSGTLVAHLELGRVEHPEDGSESCEGGGDGVLDDDAGNRDGRQVLEVGEEGEAARLHGSEGKKEVVGEEELGDPRGFGRDLQSMPRKSQLRDENNATRRKRVHSNDVPLL